MAGGRGFDAVDVPPDGGGHVAVLEGEVTAVGGTVDEGKLVAVAEGLGALDVTADKGESLGVPAEVFALDRAVGDGDAFGVPEGVLGVEDGIADGAIFYVLEGIFALEVQAGHIQVAAHEEGIFAGYAAILDGNGAAEPAELGGGDLAAGKGHAVTLTEGLDAAEGGVLDLHIGGVPEGGAAGVGHGRAAQKTAVDMPEGVAEAKIAVLDGDAGGLLQGGFSVGGAVKGATQDGGIGESIERAFLVEGLVGNIGYCGCIHSGSFRECVQIHVSIIVPQIGEIVKAGEEICGRGLDKSEVFCHNKGIQIPQEVLPWILPLRHSLTAPLRVIR